MFRLLCVVMMFAGSALVVPSSHAKDPFDLYVIIHGFQKPLAKPSSWPIDLMLVINENLETPDTGNRLTFAVVQPGKEDAPVYSKFLVYDWAKESNNFTNSTAKKLASDLAEKINARIEAHVKRTGDKINIHFISHSRGCYLSAYTMNDLLDRKAKGLTGFVQWTALDPHPLPGDGAIPIKSDPFFDWVTIFIQSTEKATVGEIDGKPISNNVSFDISNTLRKWKENDTNLNPNYHSLTHYWYHWMYNDGSLDIQYQDPVNQHIQSKLTPDLRKLLYGSSTIVETFNTNELHGFELFNNAKALNGLVDLTGPEEWKIGSMWSKTHITGDFAVDFSFIIDNLKIGDVGQADGLTITLAPSNRARGSGPGGSLGIEGITDSVSVAFDTYVNQEHNDPIRPWNYISLRSGGSPKYIPILNRAAKLPEPSISGNKFLVRVACIADKAMIRVYSFGQDKSTEVTLPLDPSWKRKIKDGVYVAFTAATATGYESHKIIGPIIVAPAVYKD